MADFAIVEDGKVVNVIVADSEQIAEAMTGLDVLPVIDGAPGIGWTLEVDGWRSPFPFPSWSWDGTTWTPPSPMPEPDETGWWAWDEDAQAWTLMPVPESERVAE